MTPEHGSPGARVYRYRPLVLAQLERHGIRPRPDTPPELVRGYVRELYKYEIRALRARMLRQEFPREEYCPRVEALRNKYPVLALLPRQFVEDLAPSEDLPPS